MATEPSNTHLGSGDAKPENPVSETVKPSVGDNQVSGIGEVKDSSPASVFVNSEPIREDQVQNAVKFLSHPKVSGSPIIYRRSFLEKKGLTKEEIDEAFRRVPDPSSAITTSQPVVSNPGGQVKPSAIVQQQPPGQILHSTSGLPLSNMPKGGLFTRFHWSHALFALGFLAVSGAGTAVLFKNTIIPRLKSWVRKVVLETEKEEGTQKDDDKRGHEEGIVAAAKATAVAASDLARASQEMLMAKSEEKVFFAELIKLLNVQLQEMKSMSGALQRLDEGRGMNRRVLTDQQDDYKISGTTSRQPYANGKASIDSQSVRPLSPPTFMEPSAAIQSKSYTEIMDMIQSGENPFNIRDINGTASNPNQTYVNPYSGPRPKAWETIPTQNSSTELFNTRESSKISGYEYTDTQSNDYDTFPLQQLQDVRITEIEAANQQKLESSYVSSYERPPRRSWVPPKPPSIVMPEAASAIRQPKKQPQQGSLTDDQLLSRSADLPDELQRITKISETGGLTDANGEDLGPHSSEIQNDESP